MEKTKMCVFFSRISKRCARRANSCFFSSLPRSPYLIVSGGYVAGGVKTPEGTLVKPVFLDPTRKEKTVFGQEILIPDKPRWISVGASQGWIMRKDTTEFHLTEAYKPWVSSPRVLSLPDGFSLAREHIVSLSSSDPVEDDECLVCTKFDDFSLSVCRPRDSKWTHILDRGPEGLLPAYTITYSKRHKAFYFTSRHGFFLGSVDLSNDYKLKYHHLRLRNMPLKIVKIWNKIHDTCQMTQHLVDSPSGDLFYILWYTSYTVEPDYECEKVTLTKPKRFMVFREDERSQDFNYTEDIGDLCIFLGKNEAFSVPATMYPGLTPNSIYYTYPSPGPRIGCYSLASTKTRCLTSNYLIRHGTFWIDPADASA